jgi:hypothetical protein
MLNTMRRVAHPLLTVLLALCFGYLLWRDSHRPGFGTLSAPESERLSDHADIPLRNYLGAKWLGGDYELPAGERHCAVVLLKFEDGKFSGRQGANVFSPRRGGSRVVPYYVMWGPGPNGFRVVNGWPGAWSGSKGGLFYEQLDGGLVRSYGTADLGELRGYRVIGHAQSSQTRRGRDEHKNHTGDVRFAIENFKCVLVLGIKPFASEEEARDWVLNPREEPDP